MGKSIFKEEEKERYLIDRWQEGSLSVELERKLSDVNAAYIPTITINVEGTGRYVIKSKLNDLTMDLALYKRASEGSERLFAGSPVALHPGDIYTYRMNYNSSGDNDVVGVVRANIDSLLYEITPLAMAGPAGELNLQELKDAIPVLLSSLYLLERAPRRQVNYMSPGQISW